MGIGLNYNILDFEIGAYFGWDHGFGDGLKWNYHGEPWIGFGIGYNIAQIGGNGED